MTDGFSNVRNLSVQEWYNVVPDIPLSLPPLKNSPNGKELERLENILPRGLYKLNFSSVRYHKIPDDVSKHYVRNGRPTPLVRARHLEKYIGTSTRIYLKREDVIPTGSFKLNTAIAQVAQAKAEGYSGVVTETGAGQWGLALSVASTLYGLKCVIFMAHCSYNHKLNRRKLMEMFGATVYSSPSQITGVGRTILQDNKEHPGSIGMAISEAIEFALQHNSYAYTAGSNFNYVYLHQSVIGLETIQQLKALGETPTTAIACMGGGSNFSGFVLPLVFGKNSFNTKPQMVACESTAVPRLTKGKYRYDHGDSAGLTPLAKVYTLGRDFIPPPIHVGGLRQHNSSLMISALFHAGMIRAIAFSEKEAFEAGMLLARLEGIFAAPESCHAVCGVIQIAKESANREKNTVIVCCVSGSGILDLAGYTQYNT